MEIKTFGVIGSGQMGNGIAQVAAASGLKIPAKIFGFVNNIHELMDASDIVISKPGGLTASEVLAKAKPMIIIDPIPGQEQRNCEYLLEAGAAVRLYEPEDAPYKVQSILGDPARWLRRRCRWTILCSGPCGARRPLCR